MCLLAKQHCVSMLLFVLYFFCLSFEKMFDVKQILIQHGPNSVHDHHLNIIIHEHYIFLTLPNILVNICTLPNISTNDICISMRKACIIYWNDICINLGEVQCILYLYIELRQNLRNRH